jgi:hypothetical protein
MAHIRKKQTVVLVNAVPVGALGGGAAVDALEADDDAASAGVGTTAGDADGVALAKSPQSSSSAMVAGRCSAACWCV